MSRDTEKDQSSQIEFVPSESDLRKVNELYELAEARLKSTDLDTSDFDQNLFLRPSKGGLDRTSKTLLDDTAWLLSFPKNNNEARKALVQLNATLATQLLNTRSTK